LRGEKRRGEEGGSTGEDEKRRGEEGMTTGGQGKPTGEDEKRQILLALSTVHRALSLGDVDATQTHEDARLGDEKTRQVVSNVQLVTRASTLLHSTLRRCGHEARHLDQDGTPGVSPVRQSGSVERRCKSNGMQCKEARRHFIEAG
jgi:hypothetical protein